MPADYAYFVQMDIPSDWEAEFNRVYDTEHAKYLCQAPGVHTCNRYQLESTNAAQFARYAALYGIDEPGVPYSEGWRIEGEKGDWATKIRPHATNRTHTMLKRISDAGDPTAEAAHIFVVRTDIPADAEDEFNRLYDTVHLPGLCAVDGVAGARRYRVEATNADGFPKYVAVYQIEDPSVLESDAWKAAAQDEWAAKVSHKCVGLTRAVMRQVARHPAA
ncbi:MAG: hypothetical protein OXF79_07285 [Chloroflexi bacterium]|nr:hypothetical protein [Chloroflexota bacterium]